MEATNVEKKRGRSLVFMRETKGGKEGGREGQIPSI
jgi:hypothetical protein